MRLQLILLAAAAAIAAAAIAAGPRRAAAEPPPDQASATVRVYADDDRVTVWSPAAHGQLTAGRVTTDVDVTLDAVTAASVDVVTSASPLTVHERRLEAGLGVTVAATPTTALRASGDVSHEHDYDALRAGLGLTTDLASRNTTVELRATAGHDHATAVNDPTFSGERDSAGLTAVVTQLVDRRTVLDLTVDGAWSDGWQASPYRRVLLSDPRMPLVTSWREATPSRRLSLAIALRGRRALGERWFGTAVGRGYVDDWSMHSATATVGLRRRLAARTLVGAQARGYLQDAASFWRRHQPDATEPPRYRTADRTLGPMADAELELVGERTLDAGGRTLTIAAGGLARWFLDDAVQHRRLGLTTTVSFTSPL
ncbi:MAG TPA: DUF3570 domain-containing protein [Kofleriaceae bacterium]|nr:DUF3570 domain-containing protein [Kofleriaceae bacterium]